MRSAPTICARANGVRPGLDDRRGRRLYVAILGEIGIVPLAVTTNLTINFLRKPAADKRIVGVCRLIKVGKVQAVGEVHLYSEGDPEAVAHAVGTYSIPKMR